MQSPTYLRVPAPHLATDDGPDLARGHPEISGNGGRQPLGGSQQVLGYQGLPGGRRFYKRAPAARKVLEGTRL